MVNYGKRCCIYVHGVRRIALEFDHILYVMTLLVMFKLQTVNLSFL